MKFKVFIVSVFFVCCLLPDISLAQNKVVVIPLLSNNDDEIPTVTSNGQVWMDRNLGALRVAQSVDDYFAYGFLYQWGRLADGHEDRGSDTTTTPSAENVPGHDDFILVAESPFDWRSPQYDDLWQGGSGTNNPCPAGFRVPTLTEWETERASWSENNAAGAFASPLKLVVAGAHLYSDGTVSNTGRAGYYWSSTVSGSQTYGQYFGGTAAMGSYDRAYGLSLRCIKD